MLFVQIIFLKRYINSVSTCHVILQFSQYLMRWLPETWSFSSCSPCHLSQFRKPFPVQCINDIIKHSFMLVHPALKPEYTHRTRSIPWLLMAWFLVSPEHQQPWYWPCRIKESFVISEQELQLLLLHLNSLRPSDAYMCQWSNHHWFR